MKHRYSKKQYVEFGMMIFLIVWVAGYSFYRIFWGVEISDEMFYIADASLVNNGGVPFVNMWMQTAGAALLYAPLIKVYELINGGMDGIFLFMRAAFCIYRIGIFLLIYFMLRKGRSSWAITLAAIPLVPFYYSLIPMFSYTSVPFSLLLLVSVLLYAGWEKFQEGKGTKLVFICGILMALVTLSYPTLVIDCCIMLILIAYYFRTQWKKYLLQYVLGGGITAIIVTGYLIFKAGTITNLIHGLSMMLVGNPYMRILRRMSIKDGCNIILQWVKYPSIFLFAGIISIIIVFIIKNIAVDRKRNINIKLASTLGISVGIILGLCYSYKLENALISLKSATAVLFIGVICYRIVCNKNKKLAVAFNVVAIPEIVAILILWKTVIGGISNRYYVVFPMGLLCILYCYYALKFSHETVSIVTAMMMSLLCILIGLNFNFGYLYREDSLGRLDTKIDRGIYKGIYTSEQKANSLVELEEYISENVNKNDKVLFMDCAPMAYLMSDAHYCTPATWEIMAYHYGINDDAVMKEYFALIQDIPDKIIYIDTGRDELLSIEKKGYKFNEFVNEYYLATTGMEDIGIFRVKIYEQR